jgi:hypothetical protein
MIVFDEHTGLGTDTEGASAASLRCSLLRGVQWRTDDRDVAAASHAFSGRLRWLWLRRCAVSIEAEEVSLTGVASHEAAIAKIEAHLHGPHEAKAPVDPLCLRPTEP